MNLKLISWNVNGLRAVVGKNFMEFFNEIDADIFCLQETKLQAGQIDIFPYLTSDQATQLKDSFNIEVGEMSLVQALFLNNKVKPFDNPDVRRAMCLAVNRDDILSILNDGKGKKIGSGVYAGFGAYFNDACTDTYTYNLQEAKELLKKAGYPNGFTFTCVVPSNYTYHVQTAQVLASQLQNAGITMKIQMIEWASWLSDVYQGHNFEATIVGLDSQLAPSDILKYYISGSKKNFINIHIDFLLNSFFR